jgi:hypothetical protein
MFGRLAGLVVGLAIALAGLGLWKPLLAAKYEKAIDFAALKLGPFDQYRAMVSLLIIAAGLVIAVAALQREPARKKTKLYATVLSEPEEAAPVAETLFAPAEHHHDGDDAEPAHAEAHT